MLLAVDVGNTQTVLGLYAGEELRAHWRVATAPSDTADELHIRVKQLLGLEGLDCSLVKAVVLSSVVPGLSEQWLEAGLRLSGQPVLNVTAELDTGLTYKYDKPSEIGADRVADAVAAVSLYGAPVIVVDFGTATNIEVIDRDGAFVGGIIAPGLVTSAEALFAAAARLSSTAIEVPATAIGKSTREAVKSGLTYGEIDRIDGLIRRVFSELGYLAPVIATGGLSSRVATISATIDLINDDLTIEGLRLIYERLRAG